MSENTDLYHVIANCEDEYALWPVGVRVPRPWRAVGVSGPRQCCFECVRLLQTTRRLDIVRSIVERERIWP